MSRVRSLVLCSRPPWPLLGGDRIRTFHLARALASLGPVGIVAALPKGEESAAARGGLPFVDRWWFVGGRRDRALARSGRALLSGEPLQQALYDSPEARAATAAAIDGYAPDVILAHLLRTVPWLPTETPPVLVDVQDALSEQYRGSRGLSRGWRGAAMAVERHRIDDAEAAAVARADRVSFISDRDRRLVLGDGPDSRAVIVPPVIDVDAFGVYGGERQRDLVGFLGNLRTASNRDMVIHFARHVLPLVRAARPDAQLRIMGMSAPREVKALGRRPGITYVGPVDDLVVELGRCQLTICPLRFGSGVQNKVLQSLAVGTPVVVTPPVAESLGSAAVGALAVGELDADFASRILEILADEDERARLSGAGRAFVEQVHAPKVATAGLLAAVRELARA